ncbi:MAG: hypothetical protein IT314_14390 [Anaerolineales bacterium]|nr:hypothetical protein [Anaerolineales bacterium]
MKLKIKQQLAAGAVGMGIVLNACGVTQNQAPTLQPSLPLSTSTPIPITTTSTSTSTITPTMPPTSWVNSLLTAASTLMNPLSTLPPECGTVSIGHAGTQTIDNLQKILIQGTAVVCGDGYLDGNSDYLTQCYLDAEKR